ncbi:hypothetical protein AOXY_G18726 [Acipenser oxyrinchus oxyrinchus]|uniref:Uncharacterized protein n=1 Tax=Acipenser oxyrinchus oxyrinchus TaxID=40147 RepID=A0AAD8D268_ACIOX|nr:hypothetical protein AOXY_G18726 [Acipenser oxyrinchus oxyrinchus]
MKKVVLFCLCLVLLSIFTDASPILEEKKAKQLLRSKRQDRPRKAGHPDEPMREYLLHQQRLEQSERGSDSAEGDDLGRRTC